MRPELAIVGGGVTAGLAAYMLSSQCNVVLFRPHKVTASPIPEIVPRRAFFDCAGIPASIEAEVVTATASYVTEVHWVDGKRTRRCSLRSDADYFIYDKGKLASWLVERAYISDVVENEVTAIDQIEGFGTVLDCRGWQAVSNDPSYVVEKVADPVTRCSYVIATRPEHLASNVMHYWSGDEYNAAENMTFFTVPVGSSKMSLGCSYSPELDVSHADIVESARRFGIDVSETDIGFVGTATPYRTIARCALSHVRPLGDARSLSCPLTEYGTMKALSHISEMKGSGRLSDRFMQRPMSQQIDPHIPMELFA